MMNFAELVFDNREVRVPTSSMGMPCEDQCKGTPADILGEISSRICYDSLGLDAEGKRRGRPSHLLHSHILDVKNHSVYEHFNFTVKFENIEPWVLAQACMNRKGIWIEIHGDNQEYTEISTNLRALLEWERHTKKWNNNYDCPYIAHVLRTIGFQLAPQIINPPINEGCDAKKLLWWHEHARIKDPTTYSEDQAWISLYLCGSRGWSHEQVRHRYAMSQRSTRYVDESTSDYVIHPLIERYLDYQDITFKSRSKTLRRITQAIKADRKCYKHLVEALQSFILHPNAPLGTIDKLTARKQARGAARGFLGNALFTEMIYSAPISGWKWILSQRASAAADAEIRRVYEFALPALLQSQYASAFDGYELIDSPDGLGRIMRKE